MRLPQRSLRPRPVISQHRCSCEYLYSQSLDGSLGFEEHVDGSWPRMSKNTCTMTQSRRKNSWSGFSNFSSNDQPLCSCKNLNPRIAKQNERSTLARGSAFPRSHVRKSAPAGAARAWFEHAISNFIIFLKDKAKSHRLYAAAAKCRSNGLSKQYFLRCFQVLSGGGWLSFLRCFQRHKRFVRSKGAGAVVLIFAVMLSFFRHRYALIMVLFLGIYDHF